MADKETRQEKEMIRIMQDPVLWIKHHSNSEPRWYQEQALRHPHNRTVLRWGRRLGKCIAEGQRMLDAETGAYLPIEEWYERQRSKDSKHLKSFSLDNQYKLSEETVFQIEQNGKKPVFEVLTSAGAKVQLTGNHPVLTLNGWTEVDDLKVGESIALPESLPVFGNKNPSEEEVKTLAYMLPTYRKTKMGKTLEFPNDESRETIVEFLKKQGLQLYPKSKLVHFVLDKENKFDFVLKEENQDIPAEVFEYNKEKLAIFIAAIFDVRGYKFVEKNGRGAELGYITDNKELVYSIRHLLLRFGIQVNLRVRNKKDQLNPVYTLVISKKEEVVKFIDIFGSHSIRDYFEVEEAIAVIGGYSTNIPNDINPYIREKMEEKGMTPAEMLRGSSKSNFPPKVSISPENLAIIANNLEDGYLYDIAHANIQWSDVKSITPVGKKMTYDVMMPKYHNLIIEDVCVHNTWTMVAHILWAAFTNVGGTNKRGNTICLVATPYDSQALDIFKKLVGTIEDNEILKSSIKSIIKNPYNIQLKNGSEIRLFTTGAKTSSGAASLRGQAADYIYMDEMDKYSPFLL